MSRNGAGVYSLPAGSTIANGDTSDASDLNTPLQDIETDLNTARPIVAGGTGATSASAARTALGLAIGTNVQAYDAALDDISGLAVTDGNFIVGNGTNWVAESGATARTSLGLTIGTDVQAYDADLAAIAALTRTRGDLIVGGASAWTDLAIGTSGQILTSDGTDVSWSDPASVSNVISVWADYNQSTPAITASDNVTSITDNAAGQWTVNITNAFAAAAYGVASCSRDNGSNDGVNITLMASPARTASAVKFRTKDNASDFDSTINGVMMIGVLA